MMATVAKLLVCMVATIGFSMRFQAPRSQYLLCALVGGSGWLVYTLVQLAGISPTVSTFLATLVLVVLSRLFSALRKMPAVVFLFAGIYPLVPGAGIYQMASHIFLGENALAGQAFLFTIKVAGAIVLGILFGYALPHGWFNRLAKRDKKQA